MPNGLGHQLSRLAAAGAMAAAGLVAAATPASACSCGPPAATRVEGAVAIFAGEVLSVERLPASPGGSNIATLRVSETWKGQVEAEVRVSAPLQDGFSCGFNFSQGQRVVVFASRPASDGSLIQGARAPVGSIFGVIGCDILAQPIQQRGVADELARLLR